MTKTVSGEELKKGLLSGIEKLNGAVSDTLGPYGNTVFISDQYGKRRATKDGVTVAKSFLELEDEIENYGAQTVKEVSIKNANESGDGTTTATLLATTIVQEGYKVIEKGSNVTQVKKGIEDGIKQVIDTLKTIKVDITEDSQIKEVASISGNNDSEIGEIISAAIGKVGREGVVVIEKSKSGETSLEVVEGMQFDRGYKSPYFVTDNDTMTASLEKPLILIYNGKITSAQDVVGVMNVASLDNRPLLIIAEDIEGEALSTLLVNKVRGIVNSIAVKAPDFGDRRTAILEDIAIIVGGEVISPEKGMKLDKLSPTDYDKYLGSSRLVNVSKEKTTIVDGNCSEEDIENRAKTIKSQIDLAPSAFEREKLQERLGRMVGGVAIISVGGNSELEIDEKKDRVDDALFATKSALEEGIVPGGGTALLYASQNIKFDKVNKDVALGQEIVFKACQAPFIRILENAGYESKQIEEIQGKLLYGKYNVWNGYDLKTESIVNMKDRGILDPLKVSRCALINASSVASTILTTNYLVFEKREDRIEQKQQLY